MADDISYSYQVPGTVPVIRQIGLTCWAAATAMMIAWRKNNQTLTTEQALGPLGKAPNDPKQASYLDLYKRGSGLRQGDMTNLAYAAGMQYPSAPVSFSPKRLIDLMATRRSPLMVVIYYANTLGMTHYRVVTRIYTNFDNGMNTIEYNDPNDLTSQPMFLEDFINQMEAAADKFPHAQVFYW